MGVSGQMNESNTVVIEPDDPAEGPVVVRQIAGLIARRIVCDLKVGDRAKLLLNAVVAHDVENEEIVSGFYAMEHRQWKRAHKALCDLGAGEANG